MATIELFTAQTVDGDSVSFEPSIGSIVDSNRKSYLQLNGTLGDAAIALQVQDPNGNWHSTGLTDEIKLATDTPGVFIIDYSDEINLRITITGAGGGTNLSIWAKNVEAT